MCSLLRNKTMIQEITDLKVFRWDEKKRRRIQIQIVVTISSNNLFLYTYNGAILRKLQQQKALQNHFYNLEQIISLDWQVELGENNCKLARWMGSWNGKQLQEVNGYFENGMKQGIWNQLFRNYFRHSQVYEQGEYFNHKKVGKWKFLYLKNEIGGGSYDREGYGVKVGRWIDLDDEFYDHKQVIYDGVYKNGKKIGSWDILFNNGSGYKQIGGGSYDREGYGVKVGRWIDLDEEFYDHKQVVYDGEYKNGKKIGSWDIRFNNGSGYKQIGGGQYDNLGENRKIGKWTEINERCINLTNSGEYKNAKKVGRWQTWWNFGGQNQAVGGGSYDEEDRGIKIGRWIEIVESFSFSKQLTFIGEYQNGNKVGIWKRFQNKIILYACEFFDQTGKRKTKSNINSGTFSIGDTQIGKKIGKWEFFSVKNEYIGGGSYGGGIKIGKWNEPDFLNNATYVGVYKYGKKVGQWDSWLLYNDKLNMKIGGGSYDEGGGNIKIGMWVEWQKIYINHFNNYITYNGEYKNGQKVGRWEICLIQFNKESNNWKKCVSGGGSYDEVRGLKIGKWVEIVSEISQIGEYLNGKKVGIWKDIDNENKLIACVFYGFGGFELNRSMTYYSYLLEIGNIQNGKKVGKWEIWSRNNEFMGGGSYDEGGLKIGRWIDLDKVNSYKQKNIGLYKYGKKVGQWDSWLLHGDKLNMKIGGGSYDEEGHEIKFGMWIELDEIFIYQNFRYITQKGEYKNGYKVGRWDINLIQFENKHNKRIGGGFYDQEGYGKKIGQWIELDEKKKFILNGEYKNGYKVGRWDISLIQCDNERNKLIGGGSYDEGGHEIKIGKWIQISKNQSWNYKQITENGEYNNDKKVGIWVEVKIKRNNQYMKVKKIIICGN